MNVPVRAFLHAALIATFGLAGMACSGSDDPEGSAGSSGNGGSSGGGAGGGGAGGAAGDSGSGGGSGSGGSSGSATKGGQVFLSNDDGGSYSMGAAFAEGDAAPAGCTFLAHGPCVVTECTGTPVLPDFVSAGSLTVTGGALAAPGVVMTPSASATYFEQGTGPLFAPGDLMKVSAAGDVVPAFELTVTAPGSISITAPVANAVIPRTSALSVAWTGGKAGEQVNIGLQQVAPKVLNIACSFDAASGSGSVPASALALLAAGFGSLGGGARASSQQVIDGWTVGLEASQPAAGGGMVTFE